jgi:hypothetical protein
MAYDECWCDQKEGQMLKKFSGLDGVGGFFEVLGFRIHHGIELAPKLLKI